MSRQYNENDHEQNHKRQINQHDNNRQLVTTIFVPNNGTAIDRNVNTSSTITTSPASSNNIVSFNDNNVSLFENHNPLLANNTTLPRRSNSSISSLESSTSLPSSSTSFESLAYPRNKQINKNKSITNDTDSDASDIVINNINTPVKNDHGITKIKKSSSLLSHNNKTTFIVSNDRRHNHTRTISNWHTASTSQRLFSPTIPISSVVVKHSNTADHIINQQQQVNKSNRRTPTVDKEEITSLSSSSLRNHQRRQLDGNETISRQQQQDQFMNMMNTNIVQEPYSRKQLLLNQQIQMNMGKQQYEQANNFNSKSIQQQQQTNNLLVPVNLTNTNNANNNLAIDSVTDASEYASVLIRDLHYEVGRGRHKKTILDSINLTVPEGSM